MVTPQQVAKMVADRPKKFTAEQVAFIPQSDNPSQTCGGCYHWYQSNIARRAVCEIYAPATEDRKVPAEATCAYWTVDGVTYPRIEKRKTKKPTEKREAKSFG